MKKLYITATFLITCFITTQSLAGIGYIICVGACEVAATALLLVNPPAGLIMQQACIVACGPAGFWACFAETTQITVLENGEVVDKVISEVCAGDIVRTLDNDGKPTWTNVLKNTKIEGDFEFIQIIATNETNYSYQEL